MKGSSSSSFEMLLSYFDSIDFSIDFFFFFSIMEDICNHLSNQLGEGSAPVEVNLNLEIGQSSIVIAPTCKKSTWVFNVETIGLDSLFCGTTGAAHIPMYIGCPILNFAGVQVPNNIVTNASTVVLDSDGGEEPAVTTDVMFSGN